MPSAQTDKTTSSHFFSFYCYKHCTYEKVKLTTLTYLSANLPVIELSQLKSGQHAMFHSCLCTQQITTVTWVLQKLLANFFHDKWTVWFSGTKPTHVYISDRCKLKTEHTFVIIQLELFHAQLFAAGIRLNPVKHTPTFVRENVHIAKPCVHRRVVFERNAYTRTGLRDNTALGAVPLLSCL